jgi:dihydrofolate reductase
MIAAVDETGGIGKDGSLPWHLSDDLKNFKRLTMGHHLIMGRKTFEGILSELPGRKLIVLSRDMDYESDRAQISHSLDEALEIASKGKDEEVFVIGGAEIFAQAMPIVARFYLTRVHAEVETDVFFPEFDEKEWEVLDSIRYEAGQKNDHPFTISTLQKS